MGRLVRNAALAMIAPSVLLTGCFALFTLDDYGSGARPPSPNEDGGNISDGDVDGSVAPKSDSEPGPTTSTSMLALGTDQRLYRIDARTLERTTVARLLGCPELREIAVDRNGRMMVTSMPPANQLYELSIDGTTGLCTRRGDAGSELSALTFLAAGDLVGVDNTQSLVRIDPSTGRATKIGQSDRDDIGDLAAGNGKLYAFTNQSIIEIDPATGATKREFGSVPNPPGYGLAFAAGKLFAFTRNNIYRITPEPFEREELGANAAGLEWNGAASVP